MSDNNKLIQDLTEEQIDEVAGGQGEILARYLRLSPENTKGAGQYH